MDFNSRTAYLLLVVVFCVGFAETANFTNSTNTSHQSHTSKGEGIVIFKFDIHHVATPFVVCCWVLLASISKICECFLLFPRCFFQFIFLNPNFDSVTFFTLNKAQIFYFLFQVKENLVLNSICDFNYCKMF